jgi:hypothetical protein
MQRFSSNEQNPSPGPLKKNLENKNKTNKKKINANDRYIFAKKNDKTFTIGTRVNLPQNSLFLNSTKNQPSFRNSP